MGLSILTGGVLYRFNSYLIGFDPAPGWNYFPSFGEIFVSIGLVSFEIMLYMILVKTFPILSKPRTA
jgi:Ni/Fe-hydrogenase subunit HybB-like protein